jgi:ZIP family zinc transporter
MAYTFILLTFVSTMLGGFLGLKFKDKRHLMLGFTAGVLISVVAFDILPELFEMVASSANFRPDDLSFNAEAIMEGLRLPMIALVIGFLVFHIAEKVLLIHHVHEDQYGDHKHPSVGTMSALALSAHSFLDGMGIGLGFQVSTEVGIAVAIAVLAHDFSDGLNTVSLMLAHKNTEKRAIKMLLLDAVAPVLGGLSTLFFTLSSSALTIYLGLFAGFLLYIGASDILPEAHSKDSSYKTVLMTVLGAVLMYIITVL